MLNRSIQTKRTSIFASFLRWFDSQGTNNSVEPGTEDQIDWFRIVPFIGMHLMCLGVIWVGWSWFAIATAALLYFVRMFAITGFYHRYFSHRTFQTSRFGQFVFAVLGASSTQRGPLWWAAHHRYHHSHADMETDPHSPLRKGFLWSHMLWFLSRGNFPTNDKAVKDLAKYPELRFLDRYDTLVPFLLGALVFFLGVFLRIYFPALQTNGTQMLIWGYFVSTILLFHGTWTINSFAHRFGSKRYRTQDDSRNNFVLSLITLGEGWHNNHHHYPSTAKQGFYWWEIDITYYLLVVLSWFRIIWDLKPLPEHIRNANRLENASPSLVA